MSNHVARAVIGRKHFGNPIPEAWYTACRDYESCNTNGWNSLIGLSVAMTHFDNEQYESSVNIDRCYAGLKELNQD